KTSRRIPARNRTGRRQRTGRRGTNPRVRPAPSDDDSKRRLLPARLAASSAEAPAAARATATAACTTATTAAAAKATRLLGTGFIDRQTTAVEFLLVEPVDRGARALLGFHFDEGEPPRLARGAVAHQAHRLDRTGLGEQVLNGAFLSGKREITDIQLQIH